jgi:Protein of unknown function (DUF2855)
VLEATPPELADGQALLAVDTFGLSSNNITYAKFGDAMSYWSFFPAEEGWGHMPVWGFADVQQSHADGLPPGTRLYGYLPPSSYLLVTPTRVDERGFTDASAHRAELPGAYNRYGRTDADPIYEPQTEELQMLLRPLFFTSYLIDDFLADAGLLGSASIVLSSASSKTAIGLAFLLSQREGTRVIGLTSESRRQFTERLGVYESVLPYEELSALPQGAAVYVDMSGDAQVREAVHGHFGSGLLHSAVVGATHHDRMGEVPESLPGPRPQFFFAPDRVVKRTADWGGAGLEQRLAEAWQPFTQWAGGWVELIRARGGEELRSAYLELLDGRIDPAQAHVFSLRD